MRALSTIVVDTYILAAKGEATNYDNLLAVPKAKEKKLVSPMSIAISPSISKTISHFYQALKWSSSNTRVMTKHGNF